MIDTQQQYIKLNIRGEISIIGVQAHSGRKRDILVFTKTALQEYLLPDQLTRFVRQQETSY
jgi:hypothetical protein